MMAESSQTSLATEQMIYNRAISKMPRLAKIQLCQVITLVTSATGGWITNITAD